MAINAEEATLSFATSDFAGDSEKYVETETTSSVNGISFAYNNFNPKTGQIRGNKAISKNFYFYNTTPLNGKIKSITITAQSAGLKSANIYIAVGAAKLGNQTNGNQAGSSTTATQSVTYDITDGGSFFEIYFKSGATTGTVLLSEIRITYEASSTGGGEVVETVERPTFSVASGVFTEPFDLTLSAGVGNTIYYTLDGSNPTVDSDIYDGETIRISEYTVVKATAVNAQGVASDVATATYAFQNTANTAMTVAEALAWIEEGKDATTEQYIAGYITAIKNVNLEYGNAEYSIADTIDGTDALLVYRGNYLNGEKFTAEDQIKVGDKVLIYGKLKDYNGTPEVDSYSRIVSFLEKAPDEGGEEPGDDPVVPEIPETATVVTFDFTAPSSLNPVQVTPEFGQQKSIPVNDVVFTAGNVSLSFDKGSAGTDCRIWAGTSAYDLRTYSNSTMTFTVTGAAITKIVFTGGKASTTQMSVEDGTFEGETWKGDSQSITFTAKATTNINTITVTYDTATGIEDTMVDENAPVEYYNLQGVKVANPENGIFIKKQGGRTSKVVL